MIEGDGSAVDLEVAAFRGRDGEIERRADIFFTLMGDQAFDIAARGNIEPPTRVQRVGPVVLAGMPGIKRGGAEGAKLQGMHRPVCDGAHIGAHVAGGVALPEGASENVVGGQRTDFQFWKNHKTTHAQADRIVGLEVEQFRRPSIAQGLRLDAEHIGIIAVGRDPESGNVLGAARVDA